MNDSWGHYTDISQCGCSGWATPICATFSWSLFWAKSNSHIAASKETTVATPQLPRKYLNWGFFPQKSYYQRQIVFKWPRLYVRVNIWATELMETSSYETDTLTLFILWMTLCPCKAQAPISFLSTGWHM